MSGIVEFFGDVIHVYTRAEALEDGVLVDVSEMAREAGSDKCSHSSPKTVPLARLTTTAGEDQLLKQPAGTFSPHQAGGSGFTGKHPLCPRKSKWFCPHQCCLRRRASPGRGEGTSLHDLATGGTVHHLAGRSCVLLLPRGICGWLRARKGQQQLDQSG